MDPKFPTQGFDPSVDPKLIYTGFFLQGFD
jgi:hypothetical protein